MRDIYFKHDNNGVFTDYSKDARDYLRDNFQFNLTTIVYKEYLDERQK